MGFATTVKEEVPCTTNGFKRDNRDNKLFKDLQIKDISGILTDDAVFVWDFDGIPYKCSGMVEEDYIVATNVETGEKLEAKNVTTFWGVGNKVGANSTIGIENIKRLTKGLPELTKDSFTIETKKRLKTKFINSATGRRFKSPKKDENGFIIPGSGDDLSLKKRVNMDLSDVIALMEARIDEVRKQWNVERFLLCLGSGHVFRNDLLLPAPYKGGRSSERPLLLKEARQWVVDTYPSEIAPPNFENDDLVEWYGAKSHKIFKTTNKHKYPIIGEDKDLASNPKLWINYGREGGFFKQPQAVLIQDSSVSVGTLELVQKANTTETKGTGLVWLIMQAFCFGDSSDFYHPYLKLDKSLRSHIKYGQKEAYIDFVNLKTCKEVLQKAVDNMALWFPNGLKYTAHNGIEVDIDTYSWMADVCYPVAYMTRSIDDVADFRKLCNYFKVDVSKVEDNHKPPTLPLQPEQVVRDTIELQRDKLRGMIESASNTKGTKQVLVDNLNDITSNLKELEESLSLFFVQD